MEIPEGHQIATFPVESGRGVECPFCNDTDFNSRGIEISSENGTLIFTETCSKCHQKWDERIGFGAVSEAKKSQTMIDRIYALVHRLIFRLFTIIRS